MSLQGSGLAGSFHFALHKVRPTTEPIAMLDHGRDRKRGLSKLSGVDVHVSFAIRSAPFPTVAALRPSEGPQRSALVTLSNLTLQEAITHAEERQTGSCRRQYSQSKQLQPTRYV